MIVTAPRTFHAIRQAAKLFTKNALKPAFTNDALMATWRHQDGPRVCVVRADTTGIPPPQSPVSRCPTPLLFVQTIG